MPDQMKFRPERKPITPAELPQVSNPLQAVNDVRQAIAQELGEQVVGESDVKISGNVPEAFIKAVNQQKQSQSRSDVRPEMRVTGSARLEELLEAIRKTTAVYEPVTLPSRGVFYDGDNGPRDGVIHIRPMTGEEEQILATPRFVRKGQAINMIFNRCMQEKYNAEDFITQDRTFLLIYLRGISYTPAYDVEIKCPSCDTNFTTTIDLNTLEVELCPENFGTQNMKGVLPVSQIPFTFKLATGAVEQKVQEYRDRRIKNFDVSSRSDDTMLYRLTLLLEDIGDLVDKSEMLQILRSLHINDVNYLRNVVNDPPFGVDTEIGMICEFCSHEFDIELPLETNFFFPRQPAQTGS
jgi:hypothetical protein